MPGFAQCLHCFYKRNIPVGYCLSHDKYLKFQTKIKKRYLWSIRRSKQRHGVNCPAPSPNTIKDYFTPMPLGLTIIFNTEKCHPSGKKTPFSIFFKCPCSHRNNTALIKMSLFDTALVMTNTLSFDLNFFLNVK